LAPSRRRLVTGRFSTLGEIAGSTRAPIRE
jgi:hypothetical protein